MNIARRLILCTISAIVLNGCSKDPFESLDAPREFFAKHTIGTSPDFGIIKWGDPSDHVITVHGFTDDASSCSEVAHSLNTNACKETDGQDCLNPYSCLMLNK
jgi:hypothetical protein